jgi:hypothetical protein
MSKIPYNLINKILEYNFNQNKHIYFFSVSDQGCLQIKRNKTKIKEKITKNLFFYKKHPIKKKYCQIMRGIVSHTGFSYTIDFYTDEKASQRYQYVVQRYMFSNRNTCVNYAFVKYIYEPLLNNYVYDRGSVSLDGELYPIQRFQFNSMIFMFPRSYFDFVSFILE